MTPTEPGSLMERMSARAELPAISSALEAS